jgi:hypothetical protein
MGKCCCAARKETDLNDLNARTNLLEELPMRVDRLDDIQGPESVNTYGNQQTWADEATKVKSRAIGMLNEGAPFGDLLGYLSEERGRIAKLQETEFAADFGKPRLDWKENFRNKGESESTIEAMENHRGKSGAALYYGVRTAMVDRYLADGKKSLELLNNKMPNTGFRKISTDGENLSTGKLAATGKFIGYSSIGTIDGEEIELTGSLFGKVADDKGIKTAGIWVHTTPEKIPRITGHVGELHQQLLEIEGSSDRDTLRRLKLLASAAWWMCHAMPYVRGSASIVEWYIESVSASRDLKLGKRKSMLDLLAFRMSEAEFVEAFPTFFEAPKEEEKKLISPDL